MERASVQWLTGDRLHLSHGPIDVVLRACADATVLKDGYRAVAKRFETILGELVTELQELRRPMPEADPTSPVGRRMRAAASPFAERFVTPMAAVAGSVADELMTVLLSAGAVRRAYVNDGGDIAVHVAHGETLDIGLVAGEGLAATGFGMVRIGANDGIGGIATSGAGGRSFSLGVADAVIVLARDAATADVAATLVANAVDVEDDAVVRRPARLLHPDSDLGDRLVTVSVGALDEGAITKALDAGLARAVEYRDRGLLVGAALTLRGRTVTTGRLPAALPERKAS